MATIKSSPYQKARTTFAKRGSSMDDLKFHLRKQFKSRLRDMRRKSVDACRDIGLEIKEGYRSLASSVVTKSYTFNFVKAEDVLKTLEEIQNDMLEQVANFELSDYEAFIQDEVDAIVENLLTCKVCEEYSEKDICDNCSKHFAD